MACEPFHDLGSIFFVREVLVTWALTPTRIGIQPHLAGQRRFSEHRLAAQVDPKPSWRACVHQFSNNRRPLVQRPNKRRFLLAAPSDQYKNVKYGSRNPILINSNASGSAEMLIVTEAGTFCAASTISSGSRTH